MCRLNARSARNVSAFKGRPLQIANEKRRRIHASPCRLILKSCIDRPELERSMHLGEKNLVDSRIPWQENRVSCYDSIKTLRLLRIITDVGNGLNIHRFLDGVRFHRAKSAITKGIEIRIAIESFGDFMVVIDVLTRPSRDYEVSRTIGCNPTPTMTRCAG